jgi:hypothetical protein
VTGRIFFFINIPFIPVGLDFGVNKQFTRHLGNVILWWQLCVSMLRDCRPCYVTLWNPLGNSAFIYKDRANLSEKSFSNLKGHNGRLLSGSRSETPGKF